jgi:4-hydroxyphenylpyruvate dioxygenase
MSQPRIGIVEYDSFHFAVENIERSRDFYVGKLDFREVARAGAELTKSSGQESHVFAAGDVRVCVSTPLRQECKAGRYLRKHPAGVMSLSFRVEDLEHAWKYLDERGATFLAEPVEHRDASGGRWRAFEIATPLGDVAFRFVERSDYRAFAPGFEEVPDAGAPTNRYGFRALDHATSNLLTMKPLLLWYREVLGFEEFWNIQFHTKDVTGRDAEGTGLKSIVMWDPGSGVKFATNEPLRPNFRASQISKFVGDNMGPGIQHIAFEVPDILATVGDLERRGVQFLTTHPAYYRAMPERLKQLRISNVKESLFEIEKHQILVDGADDKYMLQIFLREAAGTYDDDRAGPFFYEIIQRAGDPGFGYGNFRALFESIEQAQKASPQHARSS